MAFVTATEVRERTPSISTTVYSDADLNKIITRADAEIIARAGRYRELLQGYVFGERVSLSNTGGNKRLEAQGGETSATLAMKPITASTLFLFINPSNTQDYRHIKGDENSLLTLTTEYTINTTTGVITLVSALDDGDKLMATYQFPIDTTNRAPRVILELAKSMAAYYLASTVYGNEGVSDGSELAKSYGNAMETLKLMEKNQFPITEFDDIVFTDIDEWQPSELKSVKIIRR